MKLFFNILNFVVFGGLAAIFMAAAVSQEGDQNVGAFLSACFIVMGVSLWRIINTTAEERAKSAEKRDANGVHWFWWVFWLIAFFPALIVVAIMHNGRKTRAAIREVKQAD